MHFKAFQGACETRVSLKYFLVKVTLFVAYFLLFTERRLFGYGFKDFAPLQSCVKVDQPRSQGTLSCFKKERLSLGSRERTLETRLDNDRQTDDVTSGKRGVVPHGRPLAVEEGAESSLNFF